MIIDLLDFFFPNKCLSCKKIMAKNSDFLCIDCISNLSLTNYYLDNQNTFYQKVNENRVVEKSSALFFYSKDSVIQKLIYVLKYQDRQDVGSYLADWLAASVPQGLLEDIDGIVSVPLHPKKQRKRGYNQLHVLVDKFSESCQINHYKNYLVRTKNTESQTTKKRKERLLDLENAFQANAENKPMKHLLLIDDIYTTGATFSSCYDAIKKQYPKTKISLIVLATAL